MSFLSSLCSFICSADPSIDGVGVGMVNNQNIVLQSLDMKDREQGGSRVEEIYLILIY